MVLARLMESTDLVSISTGPAGLEESPTNKQWNLAVLPSPERVGLIPAFPIFIVKLISLVPPCIFLTLFE